MPNTKSSKKNQPKRQRYVASGRMVKNKLKKIEKHLHKHPDDAMAVEALDKLKQ